MRKFRCCEVKAKRSRRGEVAALMHRGAKACLDLSFGGVEVDGDSFGGRVWTLGKAVLTGCSSTCNAAEGL